MDDSVEKQWFIGTVAHGSVDEEGRRESTITNGIPISEEEHEALAEAAFSIRKMRHGILFRLVFTNHKALKEHYAQLEALARGGQRGVNWGVARIETQLALANWLGSVRWLLDHTKRRLHDDPENLKRFENATRQEFEKCFAYRLTYKLRDYSTHCDLPPLSMHVQSRATEEGGRTDTIEIQLDPGHLLTAWKQWGGPVKRDLAQRSEPIDLLPLVDEAMLCIERIMLVVIDTELPAHRAAALLVVEAAERLSPDALEDGGMPTLIAASFMADSPKSISPTALPVAEALEVLNPP